MDLLNKATEIELISADPLAEAEKGNGQFMGYAVLGSTKITKEEQRQKLVREIKGAIDKTSSDNIGLCFRPRHGLRVKVGKTEIAIGICFECSRVEVYLDGEEKAVRATADDSEKYLDELLTASKVPLAAKPEKKKK